MRTEQGSRPRARQLGLVVQELGDELLVYDRERDVAHCLSRAAAVAWRRCDGDHEEAELPADALAELRDRHLLDEPPDTPADLASAGVSRRDVIRRIVAAGAAATAAPLIVSVVAPAAADAVSAACGMPGDPCSNSGDGAGGCCGADNVCSGSNNVCCIALGGACTSTAQCCRPSGVAVVVCSNLTGCRAL